MDDDRHARARDRQRRQLRLGVDAQLIGELGAHAAIEQHVAGYDQRAEPDRGRDDQRRLWI